MSDRFPGELTVGGPITEDQVEDLIAALNESYGALYPDWGGVPFEPKTKQDIINALDENGHIVICYDQASNGMFEETEASLTKAGISWDRQSDSYSEYDAEIVWWRPGMDSPNGVICDTDGNMLCPMEPVAEALAMLKNHTGNFATLSSVRQTARLIEKLESVVKVVPKLPRLEFVGG